MNLRSTALRFSISCALAAAAAPALAGSTRSFVLDSASVLAEGKLEAAAVTSDGTLVRGVGTKRIDLGGVPVARSLVSLPSGETYVGTGNEGKIYVVEKGTARVLAETKQLMVTSLAHDGQGTLFAGTMPKGKVFAIDTKTAAKAMAKPVTKNDGKPDQTPGSSAVREWTLPEGTESIWALAYDDAKKTLYAATGPEGKVFALATTGSDAGKASVYYDAEASHVMTLARDRDGALYAGTSDQALVLRLRGAGRADVVYDFDGNEITALAVRDGNLAVAANLFPKAPAAKATTPAPSGDASSPQASTPPPATPSTSDKAQAGKGRLYRIDKSGNATRLFTSDEGHLTTVEWGKQGEIYAGVGREGRIYRVTPDHKSAVWIDVDERQILATDLGGKTPMFTTSDVGAVYEVEAAAAQKPLWTSKVLDAGTLARFGQLSWRSDGKVSVQTRSGNTDKPDTAWSEWSSAMSTQGPIRSPAARFLQVRVQLDAQDSVVYAVEAFYLPENQPAVVTDISIEPPRAPKPDGKPQAAPSTYKLKWKVDNADGDTLRYFVFAKLESSNTWRALLRESETLTASDYNWNTDGVPNGYYRVRVQASDELDNPAGLSTTGEGESEPFLVDNHPPSLTELKVEGGAIKGEARDALGPISKLEYSVDGLEWKLLAPSDHLFDTAEEAFTLPLSTLPKGNRMVVIRATDARNNTSSSQIEVDVK